MASLLFNKIFRQEKQELPRRSRSSLAVHDNEETEKPAPAPKELSNDSRQINIAKVCGWLYSGHPDGPYLMAEVQSIAIMSPMVLWRCLSNHSKGD